MNKKRYDDDDASWTAEEREPSSEVTATGAPGQWVPPRPTPCRPPEGITLMDDPVYKGDFQRLQDLNAGFAAAKQRRAELVELLATEAGGTDRAVAELLGDCSLVDRAAERVELAAIETKLGAYPLAISIQAQIVERVRRSVSLHLSEQVLPQHRKLCHRLARAARELIAARDAEQKFRSDHDERGIPMVWNGGIPAWDRFGYVLTRWLDEFAEQAEYQDENADA